MTDQATMKNSVPVILVGLGMMAFELTTPSFGAVGVGGIVAFLAGSVILLDTDVEGYEVSKPLILAVGAVSAALFVATALMMVRQRNRAHVSSAI